MKFSIKYFFSKCDQIRSFLRIWLHLLKKSAMEIFIFCAMVLSGKHCNGCQTLHKTVTITIEILYLHKTSTIDIPEELHMACVTMKNYLVRLDFLNSRKSTSQIINQ